MSKSIENINDEIERINIKIKELNLIINKKEDDIKNIINEKDEIITKMKNKINEQEITIKENKKEISNLNQKIEKILSNMTNELKNKEDKLIEMEKKISAINKENGEEINSLKIKMKEQRIEILNKISNNFSKLNNRQLKNNNYRIIVFGECGVGKSQFCNFVIGDKTNSVYSVSESCYSSNSIDFFKSKKFTKLGSNFEITDTMGFDDEFEENYLREFSKYLELRNTDYIILIINFKCPRISTRFRKLIINLIKIFNADKLYNHFCIVITHCYPSNNKRMIKRKEALIENCNEALKLLFNDKNKNFDNKYYFVDTEIDDENNTFDEKSLEIIDIMLEEIKLDIDFLGSIN